MFGLEGRGEESEGRGELVDVVSVVIVCGLLKPLAVGSRCRVRRFGVCFCKLP